MVASATEDLHADARGEFLAALHADPVYRLFGVDGLPVTTMPPADTPAQGRISYHLRSGGHNLSVWDWNQYMESFQS